MLLKYAFGYSRTGIKLHTRSDERLFNLASLRAKQNLKIVTIRYFLFVDYSELLAHAAPRHADTAESVFTCMLEFWP